MEVLVVVELVVVVVVEIVVVALKIFFGVVVV